MARKIKPVCPYMDEQCPNMEQIDKRLLKIERIVYAIAGMIIIEYGVMLI